MRSSLSRSSNGSRSLLTRVLEQPKLVSSIRELAPAHVSKLIRHVGLEDAGEILSLLTREQLELVLDEELWESDAPGRDEAFDAARFSVWLEVLLEGGEQQAADKLAILSEDLLCLGFSRAAFVIDLDELGVALSGEEESEVDLIEKALDGSLCHEFDQFRVIARREDGWDAVVGALDALNERHHAVFRRVLERCAAASSEYIEDNGGFYEVLTSEEVLEEDAAAERESRRAREGFIAPSAAASFLALALRRSLRDILAADERDAVTRAYFRELERGAPADRSTRRGRAARRSAAREWERILGTVGAEERGVDPSRLLTSGTAGQEPGLLVRALTALRESHPAGFQERSEELAFLANVLIAGANRAGDRFRPIEAIEKALAVCQRGLAYLLESEAHPAESAELVGVQQVARNGMDKLFQLGWHLEHADRSCAPE